MDLNLILILIGVFFLVFVSIIVITFGTVDFDRATIMKCLLISAVATVMVFAMLSSVPSSVERTASDSGNVTMEPITNRTDSFDANNPTNPSYLLNPLNPASPISAWRR